MHNWLDYTYNIRGWLTGINNTASLTDAPNDLFAFKLNYNTTASGLSGVTGLFNGNIAETYWKTASDNNLRLYGYQYDGLNRLSKAWYKNNNNGFANTYNESLTYDLNGNIKTLQRNGGTESTTAVAIDNLTYTYDATAKNKLLKVVDATNSTQGFKDDYTFGNDLANDYTYDANGNMTVDQNKGITAIVYNHLNLPSKITFGTTGTINYLYDAAGVKLQKKVTQGTTVTTTDYLGGYQYTDNVLDFFPTAEGYVKHTLVSGVSYYNYVYNYTDHLGNVRVSYTKDPTTGTLKIIEENHNYPFGLKHNYNTTDYQFTPSSSSVVLFQVSENWYQYQYNGKEWQDELGLNWYDYGARNYDAALGRWMNVDPLAEKYFNENPYNYVGNNPIIFIDPDGKEKIIGFENNDANKNHILNASKYKDDGAIHIFAHGNTKGIYAVIDGKNISITSPEKLNTFLNENSTTWQNKKEGDEITIIFHSCNTGKNEDEGSFANKVSKSDLFKDSKIIAPTELLWTAKDGDGVGTFKAETDSDGNVIRDKNNVKKRSDEMGSWKVNENGKEIESYKGDWIPKENPTFIDKLTKTE